MLQYSLDGCLQAVVDEYMSVARGWHGLMEIEEQFITHIVQRVLKERSAELKSLDRDLSKLENINAPFPRISYDDAAKMIEELYEKETDPEKKELLKFEWGIDFGAPMT